MLEVGNFGFGEAGNDDDRSFIESRTHFGLWCVASQPLMLGLDVTDDARVDAVWPILSNAEAVVARRAGRSGSPRRRRCPELVGTVRVAAASRGVAAAQSTIRVAATPTGCPAPRRRVSPRP